MGKIFDEFEHELAAWRDEYRGRPEAEIVHLWLLSLEREQIVAVAYRDHLLLRRLASLPVPPAVRDIVRHALAWAWRDEEMHAIYVRGTLLRLGRPLLAARAFMQQLSGAIAGWVSSVRQHVRWRDAPLSRIAATAISFFGLVVGKISRAVGARLHYDSFREFCRFNVDAERTAALAWRRLAELAAATGTAAARIAEYRRIEEDEERHARLFHLFEKSLDHDDRLLEGVTSESIASEVAAIGEFFLVRGQRHDAIADNPLGSGGDVWVLQGSERDDKRAAFRKILNDCGLAARIATRARTLGKSTGELRIAVKAAFMLGYHRRDRSGLTDLDLLEELARYLKELGVADVAVVEGRNIYDFFYANRGVADVARYFGYHSPHYRIVDSSDEQVPHTFVRGIAQYTVGRTWKEADFRISFGKMRSHPVEQVYLAVANLEGVGARCDEFLFCDRQAHRDDALMTTAHACFPHFALLEGYDEAADGLVGIMGCTRPKAPRRIYAGDDAIAVDIVAARHLGVSEPQKSSNLIRTACDWFGDPTAAIRVHGFDVPIPGWRGPYHNEISTVLSFLAYPVYEYGSGRGALFVPEMDEEAFPPLYPERATLRATRALLRWLLGLKHARDHA